MGYEMLDQHVLFESKCLDGFLNLKAFVERFRSLEKIKGYMQSSQFISNRLTIVWPSLAAEKSENLPCHRTILRHETISKPIICRPIQTAAPFTIDFHVFCIERTTKNFGRFFFHKILWCQWFLRNLPM